MTETTPEEALARYEANKMHYLTRAGEELGYDRPRATAEEALKNPAAYPAMHGIAQYVARHEPLPDPNEAMSGLVDEVLRGTDWDRTGVRAMCFTLISHLRAAGLLKEGV